MNADELVIISFLEENDKAYFSRREIARKAVKRQVFAENQHWVDVPLVALLAIGKVEQNETGLYRLKRNRAFD